MAAQGWGSKSWGMWHSMRASVMRLVKKRKMMHDSIDDGSTAATPASSSSISKVP